MVAADSMHSESSDSTGTGKAGSREANADASPGLTTRPVTPGSTLGDLRFRVAVLVRRFLRWARQHKLKTALLVVGIIAVAEIITIPFISISHLKTENPVETALMHQRLREGEREGKPVKIRQKWISLSQIPKHVIDAVIVAEDGTFFSHGGIDWFEVQESIEKNIDRRRMARGASTITQQLAKNLFLSTSKDPVRKLKEVIITLLLERALTKNRILELYLNVIEWGRGIFGIEAAAQTYFGKSARLLTFDEATRLAAVIPSPLRHRPDVDSKYVLYRKQIVVNRLSSRNLVQQSPTQESTPPIPLNVQPPTGGAERASDTVRVIDETEFEGDEDNGL